jgi:allophanate hydrolase subunit 2
MSLVIETMVGAATIQDLGRHGHMHEGVPPGGAAVPTLLVAANREAANRDDAPAIEHFGMLVVRAEARIEVATPHGARILEAGEPYKVASPTWSYLAVRGGVLAPEVLGGRGSVVGLDHAARMTGALRAGARIAAADELPVKFARPPALAAGPLRVVPGPDLDAFGADALATLCRAPYKVASAARTGALLDGARIPRVAGYRERSRPMVKGAIEIAGGGVPMVLGPDHPTTGGYPILAVVASDDIERVFASASVQFTT